MAATFVMDVARSDANAILFFESVVGINDIENLILQPSAHQLLHPSYSVSDNLILLSCRMLCTYTYVARPSILNLLSTRIHKSG